MGFLDAHSHSVLPFLSMLKSLKEPSNQIVLHDIDDKKFLSPTEAFLYKHGKQVYSEPFVAQPKWLDDTCAMIQHYMQQQDTELEKVPPLSFFPFQSRWKNPNFV